MKGQNEYFLINRQYYQNQYISSRPFGLKGQPTQSNPVSQAFYDGLKSTELRVFTYPPLSTPVKQFRQKIRSCEI